MKLLLLAMLVSCSEKDENVEIDDDKNYSYEQIEDVSPDSLDRTIETARQMNEDLERMNHNLDAIFKAVTKCESDEECESLKADLARKQSEKCQKK